MESTLFGGNILLLTISPLIIHELIVLHNILKSKILEERKDAG